MKQTIKRYLDRIWKFTDDFNFDVIYQKESNPFEDVIPNLAETKINESYLMDNLKWTHKEYIKYLKRKVIIEPDFSYCIADFRLIVSSNVFFQPQKPSLPKYLLNKLFKRKKHLSSAILFDGNIGTNYFHFLTDVLHKIHLLREHQSLLNIPLIIGEEVYNTSYFQYFIKYTELKNLNWIVQHKGEYISLDEVFIVRAFAFKRTYIEQTKEILNLKPKFNNSRRIFLNRSEKSGRFINNFHDIIPVLQKYGFEIVETEKLSFEDQISLFQSVKYLISIHGAGQTNIIFSNQNLRFLEINPSNRIACQYYWLSHILNVEYYDAILGGEIDNSFCLNPDKLEQGIERMMASE